MSENVNPKQHDTMLTINAEQGAHVDTIGLAMMSIMCLLLLFAYMRAQGRNRKLIEKLARLEK